jgi:hypothetical protein
MEYNRHKEAVMKKAMLFFGFILLENCLFGQNFSFIYPVNYYGNNNLLSNNFLTLTKFSDSKAITAEHNKWPAFVLNLVVGGGIGSFVQGDIIGGVAGLCGELSGLTLMIIGLTPKEVYYPGYSYSYYALEYPNIGFAYTGLLVLLGTRIFELVRPFTYANRFLFALESGADANGQPALAAMIKLKM